MYVHIYVYYAIYVCFNQISYFGQLNFLPPALRAALGPAPLWRLRRGWRLLVNCFYKNSFYKNYSNLFEPFQGSIHGSIGFRI